MRPESLEAARLSAEACAGSAGTPGHDREQKRLRIGEVAEQAGVSVRSLRYYEEQGLLSPIRSPSGQRHYAEGAIQRVRLYQQLFAAGLSSSTIVNLMPCMDGEGGTEESRALLARQRERINAQIEELLQTRDTLDGVIASAEAYAAAQLSMA